MSPRKESLLFDRTDIEASVERLTAVSEGINLFFFEEARQGRMQYRDHWPSGDTHRNILMVRERDGKKLRRIVEKFPHDWPLHEQCAYVLRAYSGLQLYPDANHRTGLAITGYHLFVRRHELSATLEEATRFVEDVRNPRSPLNARRTVNRILERDESFLHLADFYRRNVRRMALWKRLGCHLLGPQSVRRNVLSQLPVESPADEAQRKKLG